MRSPFAPFRAAGQFAKSWLLNVGQKSYGRASRNSQLRRYLDGSAYGSMLGWNHFRETTHVAEGQGTPWSYIAMFARAVKAAEAKVTVYRDENPRQAPQMMRKSVAYQPTATEERLIDTAETLGDELFLDGYGKLFWHPGRQEAWFSTSDSNTAEDATRIAQALDDAGAAEVTVEAEASPPQDRGWVQLYPKQERHLSKQGRKHYWHKACRHYARKAIARFSKSIDHPHELDKPQRQPVSDRDPLARILRRPNPGQSGSEFFFAVIQQIRITGGAIIWKVKDEKFHRVRELYVIPTGLIQPFPPSADFPFGSIRVTPLPIYSTPMNGQGYVAPGALGELLTSGAVLDCRDIFKVGWPHPLYPADFLSPLKAGSMTVDGAGQIDRARFASLLNVLRPGMIFEADKDTWKDLSEDEKQAWLETITAANGGTLNFDKSFMPPPGITIKQTQRTAVEMDYVKSYEQMRDAEMGLHQTPPVAAGIAQASAYSAYFAALKQFLQEAVQPELDMVAAAFTRCLGPIFASYQRGQNHEHEHESARGLELDHGYEIEIKAQAIDDPELKDRMVRNLLQGKCITKNQLLALYGLPKTKEKWGEDIVGTEPQPGTDPLQALQGLVPTPEQVPGQPAAAPGPTGAPGASPPAANGQQNGVTGALHGLVPNGKAPKKADATTTGIPNPQQNAVTGRPSVGPKQNTFKKAWSQQPRTWHGRWFKKDREYGCVYAQLPELLANLLQTFAASIPRGDLADKGVERDSHITCKYGLPAGTDARELTNLLVDVQPFGVRLHRTTVFQKEDCDVLVIELDPLECWALVGLNSLISEKIDCEDSYPDFRPHVTLAYLKPGRGATYAGNNFAEGLECTFGEVVFSTPDGAKTTLPLGVTGQRASLNRTAGLEPDAGALTRETMPASIAPRLSKDAGLLTAGTNGHAF